MEALETRPAFSSLVLFLSFCNDYIADGEWSPSDIDTIVDVCLSWCPDAEVSSLEEVLSDRNIFMREGCTVRVHRNVITAYSNTRCCSDPSHGMLSFSTW